MLVDITESYANAHRRLFLLDYDGTLADIAPAPADAVPTQKILDVLARLAADPKNTVVVISGRTHQDLEAWLGHLPLSFAAEHGLLCRPADKDWQPLKKIDVTWKSQVRPLMEKLVKFFPGSLIEEKSSGIVWHYRKVVDQNAAENAASTLITQVTPLAEKHQLRILHADKVVELQPLGVNKGIAASYWLGMDDWDFILIAGDSLTDEDMFREAPESAFTVNVGDSESLARIQIASPADMLKLLASLK